MRRLVEIRQEKNRPKLVDMIMNHMQKKQEKDRKNRDKIKNKVQDMYERMMQDAEEEDDTKFNRIAAHLDRLLRIMRV